MERGKYKFLREDHGMTFVNGNLYHGKIEGFYTTFKIDEQAKRTMIMVGANREEFDPRLSGLLEEIRRIDGIESAELSYKSILIKTKIQFQKKNFQMMVQDCFGKLFGYLRSNGYKSGCFVTGIDDPSIRLRRLNDLHFMFLTDTGLNVMTEHLEEKRAEIARRPENFFLGAIGAIIGASLGGLLWAVMGVMGFWAWFAGILGFTMAFYGYQKLGGRVSKLASVFIFIVCIIAIFVGSVAEWAWHFYRAYKIEIPDLTYFEVFVDIVPFIFSTPGELMREFLMDVGVGVGLTFLVGIPMVKKMYSESAGEYTIKDID